MTGNVIHLPSGEQLRMCEQCGAAVLDAARHQGWHDDQSSTMFDVETRLAEIEEDTEPVSDEAGA